MRVAGKTSRATGTTRPNFSSALSVPHAGQLPVTEPLGTGHQNNSGTSFGGMLYESRQLATARRGTDTTRVGNVTPGYP